jgi:uncharacterized membrane protein SirB2
MMGSVQRIFTNFFCILNTIADWFLILSGLVLVCWALLSVDVAGARYLIIAAGVLLFTAGCWFRHCSLKKR